MILRFGRCRESELRITRHESRCWLKPIRFSLNSISFGARMSKPVNRRASRNRWLAFKEDRGVVLAQWQRTYFRRSGRTNVNVKKVKFGFAGNQAARWR